MAAASGWIDDGGQSGDMAKLTERRLRHRNRVRLVERVPVFLHLDLTLM
jgi:hypothetical protein